MIEDYGYSYEDMGQNGENDIIARRIEIDDFSYQGIRGAAAVSVAVIVLFFFGFFNFMTGFSRSYFFLSSLGVFALLAVYLIFVSFKGLKIIRNNPIAIKRSSEYTIEVCLDNGKWMTLCPKDIASIGIRAGNGLYGSTVAGRRGVNRLYSNRLLIELTNGKTITLHFIDVASEAKRRLEAFKTEREEDFFY